MLSSAEQAFVGRDETQAPQKTPVWEATIHPAQLWIRAFMVLSCEKILCCTITVRSQTIELAGHIQLVGRRMNS